MAPSTSSAIAQLEPALTAAVRASLGLPAEERAAFIALYIRALHEGTEKPTPPQKDSSMPVTESEMSALASVLSRAVNAAMKHSSGEIMVLVADSLLSNAATTSITGSSAATPADESSGSSAAVPTEASSTAELLTFGISGMGWGDLELSKVVAGLEDLLDLADQPLLLATQLTKVLEDRPSDLTKVGTLNLSHNAQLRGGADGGPLEDLVTLTPSLTRLDLAGCSVLKELPDTLGELVPSLRELNLNGCTRLLRLPPKIGALKQLQLLDMRNCETLEALPPSIGDCTALARLYVSQATAENGMTAVPATLCKLTQLVHLEIGCSNVSAVPEQMGDLTRLCSLILNAKVLPDSLSQLTQLEYLEAQQALTIMPAPLLPGLRQLRTLDLGHCMSLKEIPPSIGDLSGTLELLYIGSMEVSSLPDELCQLGKLTHLELLGCASLTALPAAIGQLTALKSLHMKKSGLASLPESLGELQALEVLKISECVSLSALPASLVQLGALRALEVSDCTGIATLPTGYGDGLLSLRHLDFSGCEDLADVLYDDPAVDVLEARGCGMFGPGFDIEPQGYDQTKAWLVTIEEERHSRIAQLRGEPTAE